MSNYDAPYSVESFHAVPRFGHTRDLVNVITNGVDRSDYAQGVVFIGSFILAIFFVWIILSALFFCCGPRTVGILSGRALSQPRNDERGRRVKYFVYRTTVLCSCVLSLMAGIIFLVKASTSLENSIESITEGVGDLAGASRDVTSVSNKLIEVGNETIPIRDDALNILNEGICSSFEGGNGFTIDFDDEALNTTEALIALSNFSIEELTKLRDNFETEFVKAETEINAIEDEIHFYVRASYYAIAIIILTFLLSLGAHMAWHFPPRRKGLLYIFFMFYTWFFLPLYFLVLVFTVIIVAALSAVLVVNSDICLPSPEIFVKGIMDSRGLESYPQEIVNYYIINSCEGKFGGLDMIEGLIIDLRDAGQEVTKLVKILETSQENFEQQCGGDKGSLDPLKLSLLALQNSFSTFATEDANSLLQCDRVNGIYVDFFEDGVCRNLPDALYWMFTTLSLIVAFGMVIFTLRSTMVPYLPTIVSSRNSDSGSDHEEAALNLQNVSSERKHAPTRDSDPEESALDVQNVSPEKSESSLNDESEEKEALNVQNDASVNPTTKE